jgi:nucleotide-binding universal stress UspA family protein
MSEPISPPFTYRRILFCTDFSENADFAFDFAVDAAARRPGCTLYLLHVIPETEAQFWKTYIYEVDHVDEQARAAIDEKVARSYRPRVPTGLDFQVEMRVGKDSLKILEFAREKDVDLIVLGRQGRSQLQKAWFGNVTEKVVRKAHCVVLVIPLSFEEKVKRALSRP